jgi:nitrite reductase/ring-hydroxylating ferredoxin subunit
MTWVALGLSNALEPGTSTGAIVDGREFVIWRDSAGLPHVWDDRCPHRGMRMSFGFVRGDRIACLYHGWQYDTAGQCRAVPAHPDLDVPKTIRIQTYPTVEVAGLIWATLSGEVSGPPQIEESDVTPVRSVYIDRSLGAVALALVDARIPSFAGSAASTTVAEITPDVWMLACGVDRLLIAGQAVDAARCALHIVVLGAPATYAGAGQSHFARWTEAFRDDLDREKAAA